RLGHDGNHRWTAFGPTNVANLEDLVGRSPTTPVFLLESVPWDRREFTGGSASAVRERLLQEGAVPVPDLDALVVRLRAVPVAAATPPPS
ncbi:MAG: hypothetical protein L3J86_06015, partial [Thermoplasmata archaeon]|nr:hypothetical protein [Thermoplasmata archaeon]